MRFVLCCWLGFHKWREWPLRRHLAPFQYCKRCGEMR